jgi:hypothetical protein
MYTYKHLHTYNTSHSQVAFRSPIPAVEVERGTKELETFAAKCGNVVLPESMPK